MDKTLLIRLSAPYSCDLKSKTCTELGRSIQNLKFGILIGVMLFAFSFSAEAQQPPKVNRIEYLALGSRSAGTEAFLQGLKDLGYVEGHNIVIEYRWGGGDYKRLPALAAEIVALNPSVIVVAGSEAARALRRLTTTIPIVIPDSADPVGAGLVKSLARPGGNITGLTIMSSQLGGKRLELLKETFPKISRVAVVIRSANPAGESAVKEIQVPAQSSGLQVLIVAMQKANEIAGIFSVMSKNRVQAFVLIPNPMFTYERERIVELAFKSRLPAIYPHRGFVETGGLISYAANPTDLFRRAASYVDRILKGANPADLPVEQPTKFELVINLKTAKTLGVAIPSNVLMWADKVIE
jgi:putative ABC transport system substrate-binding protein